jgi:hypothetical protein
MKKCVLVLDHFGIHLTFACLREAAPAKAGILTFACPPQALYRSGAGQAGIYTHFALFLMKVEIATARTVPSSFAT